MGDSETLSSGTTTATRWSRQTLETCSGCLERHPLGVVYRGTLEGHARTVSTVPDLPPPFPALGGGGGHGSGPAFLGPRPQIPWRPGRAQMLHRRDLRGGQKRGTGVGKTKRGKGSKVMAVADNAGLPIAISVTSASPHEVTLVSETLAHRFVDQPPEKLIGDRAYDSDPLDEKLAVQGIELIVPHRRNRQEPKTQDGRKLRRYKRRWKVERLFAWLSNFRRLVVRYEHKLDNFKAFVKLGCIIILLQRYL